MYNNAVKLYLQSNKFEYGPVKIDTHKYYDYFFTNDHSIVRAYVIPVKLLNYHLIYFRKRLIEDQRLMNISVGLN